MKKFNFISKKDQQRKIKKIRVNRKKTFNVWKNTDFIKNLYKCEV